MVKRHFWTVVVSGLVAPMVAAQGGLASFTPLTSFDGPVLGERLGTDVALIGDVDGDGVEDCAVSTDGWFFAPLPRVRVYSGASGLELYVVTGNQMSGFGGEIAGLGDLDGDGYDDFAVGAQADDLGIPNGLQMGSATVYSGATGSVLHRFVGGVGNQSVGSSVAAAGDLDLDGVPDLLVGGRDRAWAYSGATFLQIHFLTAPVLAGATGNYFGEEVVRVDDLDGDSVPDIAVGGFYADFQNVNDVGSVWVYSGATGAFLYRLNGTQTDDWFGDALADVGDIDGDGLGDFMVGAPTASVGGAVNVGYVCVYSGATGSLLHRFDGSATGVRFGTGLAGGSDIDGDGTLDLLISAPWALGTRGSIYAYSSSTGALIARVDGVGNSRMGERLDIWGDRDNDGRGEILAGAPKANPGGLVNAGAAYVLEFEPPAAGPLPPGNFSWVQNTANGHWYALLNGVSWSAANSTANAYPGVELATIRDLTENDWLFQTVMGSTGVAYVGLNDFAAEGSFVWRSGELTPWWANNGHFGVGNTPGNWDVGEPNNGGGGPSDPWQQDVVVLREVGSNASAWADTKGDLLRGAILEWDPASVPSFGLSVAGPCPGAVTVTCLGGTPGGQIGIAHGTNGVTVLSAGPCGLLAVSLAQPNVLGLYQADAQGSVQLQATVPAGACSLVSVLALDLGSCVFSNLVTL